YSGRNPQVKIKVGDFQIAVVGGTEPTQAAAATDTILRAATTANLALAAPANAYTVEEALPQLELAYTINMDAFSLKLMGGAAQHELVRGGLSFDVDSYLAGFTASANFGAAYVRGGAWMGQNVGYMIVLNTNGPVTLGGAGNAAFNNGETKILDNDATGMTFVAGFKINDMFALEAGYGYAVEEIDTFAQDDEVSTYYLQSVITLAPGVSITPEVGIVDYEEVTGTIEEITYGALKFMINF
ncbi:MAG: hypothetical protein GY699_07080, partial [Desulfobacteraceae bacterium]|nr:hypothetical protein [Desulfobacteraceae bacterium]